MPESNHQPTDSSTPHERPRIWIALTSSLVSARRRVPDALGAVAFWSAVVIPVAYPPLLISGLDDDFDRVVFLCVLAGHALALALGRTHRQH